MRMGSISRLRLGWASAAIIVGLASAAACAHAQERLWRHGIIEPKSDAGFQVMAVRGGFTARQGLKLDLPHFQNDVIALRALLAGELESYEAGRRPPSSRQRATPTSRSSAVIGKRSCTACSRAPSSRDRRISRARPWRYRRPLRRPT